MGKDGEARDFDPRPDADEVVTGAMRSVPSAASAQLFRDALIERDRIAADARLSVFRDQTDDTLTRARLARAVGASAAERCDADERTRAERSFMDAALEVERRQWDARIGAERRHHEDEHSQRNRHDDDQVAAERRRADYATEMLQITKSLLERARGEQADKADVLAIVAHELRSPLTVITLNAQCIAEDSTETATRESALEVTRAAARMSRLLSDLVDASRVESAALRIAKREQDLGALIGEVCSSYRPIFAERDMTLSAAVPTEPLPASIDHDRIVQVLSNLLGNALKYAGPNGHVTISARSDQASIEVSVSDTGPGIAPSAVSRVFERFWQAEEHGGRGLGLGLFICRKIVDAHGGSIWIESELGEGSTFTFRLPAI